MSDSTTDTQVQQDLPFMRLAVEQAKAGVRNGQSPFGAVIVREAEGGPEVVCAVHNVVWETTDPSAHAEVHAIREACRRLGVIDLAGCTIYSSTEPCPMCFSAIHWANLDRIVFGTSIADADAAGFRELSISNEEMKRLGGSAVAVTGGVLREEAAEAFRLFKESGGRTY
ncbi:MAG: nucleoside deaminase [Rhodothermales bacterium]|nr:nucleoside deaminase [Rhodothermales bacterium]